MGDSDSSILDTEITLKQEEGDEFGRYNRTPTPVSNLNTFNPT
jgi:hypothetical protein